MAHIALALLSTIGSAAAIRIATHRRPVSATEQELESIKKEQRELNRQMELAKRELEQERQVSGEKDSLASDLSSRLERFRQEAERLAREKAAMEQVNAALAAERGVLQQETVRLTQQQEDMASKVQQLLIENTELARSKQLLEAERDDALSKEEEQHNALLALRGRVAHVLEHLFEGDMGPDDTAAAQQQLAELGVEVRFVPRPLANSPAPNTGADGIDAASTWELPAPSFVLDSPGKMQRLMHACMAAPRGIEGEQHEDAEERGNNRVMALSYASPAALKDPTERRQFTLSWRPRANTTSEASSSSGALQAAPVAPAATPSDKAVLQLAHEQRAAQQASDVASSRSDTSKSKGPAAAGASASKQAMLQGSHLVFAAKERQPKSNTSHQQWSIFGSKDSQAPGMLQHSLDTDDGFSLGGGTSDVVRKF